MVNEIVGKPSKILCVDDLKENHLVVKSLLDREDRKVYSAMSGLEALKMVLKENYDLFILDVRMPGMDGLELAGHLKAINKTKNIPIIFLTAESKEIKFMKKGLELGAVSYLSKPIDDELLKLTVNTFLQLYRQHVELSKTKLELNETNKNLEETVEELKTAMGNLKITQSQLVHSEKMASLGILTASLAHEINNPMNFVYTGIYNLERILNDLNPIITSYNLLAKSDHVAAKLEEIEQMKTKSSIDEKFNSIPELIRDIKLGVERTVDVIKGLRSFSRKDQDEKTLYDLHEGLNSSLMLLRSKLTSDIVVTKEYDERIGIIKCFPSQLNQVFLNIISNAIEAVDGKGKITIETGMSKGKSLITIKDDGVGMCNTTKKSIFDPFFTTKEVGKGMGLGLWISHDIIEKHKGKIEVSSALGQGAQFKIILPRS